MRRRLFASALELVAERGPANFSIDDVIRAADVSRGTFYKYFDSPDALLSELALEVTNEIILMAEPVVLGIKDPAERVATGMRLVIRLASSNRQVAAFIVRLGWPEVRVGPVLLEFVQRDLEEGMRKRKFIDLPIQLGLNIATMTVLGAIHAMLTPRTRRDFGDQAVASALRALGVPAKEAQKIAVLPLPRFDVAQGALLESAVATSRKHATPAP